MAYNQQYQEQYQQYQQHGNYPHQQQPSHYHQQSQGSNFQERKHDSYEMQNNNNRHNSDNPLYNNGKSEKLAKHPSPENPTKRHVLPTYTQDGRLVTKGINPEGESGRSGFHPIHFFRVAWQSATPWNKWLNLLWPFVPAAIVLHFVFQRSGGHHAAIFACCYIAIIPPASLLGFAGQELARKLPRVGGILLETTLGSVVEIVLFTVLIVKSGPNHNFVPVIKAAILGSILANLLLCLGSCFLVGGLRWVKDGEQKFHAIVSEVGSGLLLVAGFGLLIPTAFYSTLRTSVTTTFTLEDLSVNTVKISRGTAIILVAAFFLYILYSSVSHDSIFDEVLKEDEERDHDRHRDLSKQKFTLFEAVLAVVISLACVSLMAVFLVLEIEYIVELGVPDNFLGLILVPLVEKVAEHITAVDEAYDNQINFALYHCLAPSIQTALLNAPLVIFIAWGLGKSEMDLNFDVFMIIILVLAIIVVGNFLRDGASNWLEGALLLLVYIVIALTTWYMPNPHELAEGSGGSTGSGSESVGHAVRAVQAMMK